jgi:hypothetical protein
MQPFSFIGPAFAGRSANYSAQKCINLYLEPGKGKSPGQLIGTPGLTTPLVTLAGGGIRGCLKVTEDISVVVSGATVYRVNSDWTTSSLGTISNDSLPVTLANNGVNVLIASAGSLYSVTTAGTSSTYIQPCGSIDTMDGYFIGSEPATNNFYWSDLFSTTFDGVNTESAIGQQDHIVRLIVDHREVWLFGASTIEVWYLSGTNLGDPSFTRISGAYIEMGCAAPSSVAKLANTIFWVGSDDRGQGSVWSAKGYTPERISTHAIEYVIGQWDDLSDAEAFTYTQEGHGFYVLSSPSANETWVFDVSTNEWHQRAYLEDTGALSRVRPRAHMHFSGKNVVGDWENGNLYEYDLNTYSDAGDPIPRIRSCVANQDPGMRRQRGRSFRLDMDTGVGLTTGQGSNPQAMLRWSRDGGKTWSNSIWRSMGAIGNYGWRTMWHRVGGGEREVYEVTITDAVPVAITGAVLG